ncbi:hypothetical protein [Streptomyces gibsoniae]|uniref:Uncharacterized protein n=1 Tax=Streptomyces gibsoniae TaxID=3075529 RepID=A0ABU2U4K3_9ACTN|nr:hypothetical protein [Streptomyces sp. DSM 41699]MDT0468099.1 hypothetical protein [Streptomyces sp. DSM 41699]
MTAREAVAVAGGPGRVGGAVGRDVPRVGSDATGRSPAAGRARPDADVLSAALLPPTAASFRTVRIGGADRREDRPERTAAARATARRTDAACGTEVASVEPGSTYHDGAVATVDDSGRGAVRPDGLPVCAGPADVPLGVGADTTLCGRTTEPGTAAGVAPIRSRPLPIRPPAPKSSRRSLPSSTGIPVPRTGSPPVSAGFPWVARLAAKC